LRPEETRDLVRYRIEQAQTALHDAKVLMDSGCSPSSIVNRCYYAMYCAALSLLQTIGQTPSKHSGVHGLFIQEFVLKGYLPRELGRAIHRVFELRQTADYEIVPPLDQASIQEAWTQATCFVETIGKYLAENHWVG